MANAIEQAVPRITFALRSANFYALRHRVSREKSMHISPPRTRCEGKELEKWSLLHADCVMPPFEVIFETELAPKHFWKAINWDNLGRTCLKIARNSASQSSDEAYVAACSEFVQRTQPPSSWKTRQLRNGKPTKSWRTINNVLHQKNVLLLCPPFALLIYQAKQF